MVTPTEKTIRHRRDVAADFGNPERTVGLSAQDSRTVLLQQVGALADDETLAKLRASIYAQHRRSEAEISG